MGGASTHVVSMGPYSRAIQRGVIGASDPIEAGWVGLELRATMIFGV